MVRQESKSFTNKCAGLWGNRTAQDDRFYAGPSRRKLDPARVRSTKIVRPQRYFAVIEEARLAGGPSTMATGRGDLSRPFRLCLAVPAAILIR